MTGQARAARAATRAAKAQERAAKEQRKTARDQGRAARAEARALRRDRHSDGTGDDMAVAGRDRGIEVARTLLDDAIPEDVPVVLNVAELVDGIAAAVAPDALVLPEYRVEDEPEAKYRISDADVDPYPHAHLQVRPGRVAMIAACQRFETSAENYRQFFLAGLAACEAAERAAAEPAAAEAE